MSLSSLAAYVASISPPFIITILLHIIFAELIVIFLIRRSLGGIFYLRAAEVVYQDLLDLIWPFVRLMFHRHIEAEVEAAWTEDTEDTDDSSTVFGDDDDLLVSLRVSLHSSRAVLSLVRTMMEDLRDSEH